MHSVHLGMDKIKSMNRFFSWWPGLDSKIVDLCAGCDICQQTACGPSSPVVPSPVSSPFSLSVGVPGNVRRPSSPVVPSPVSPQAMSRPTRSCHVPRQLIEEISTVTHLLCLSVY